MTTNLRDVRGIGKFTLDIFVSAGFYTVNNVSNPCLSQERINRTIQEMKSRPKYAHLEEKTWVAAERRCLAIITRMQVGSRAMSTAPACFSCPITQLLMDEPVITPSGYTYEKYAILDWIQKFGTDPSSGEVLTTNQLIENKGLLEAINEYRLDTTTYTI